MESTTHSRAKKGGEFGANGEWYEGGKFINTVPENAKGEAKKVKPTGRREIDRGVWEIQPFPGAISLYQMLGGFEVRNRQTGLFELNPALCGEYATTEYLEVRKARIESFNSGERWIK